MAVHIMTTLLYLEETYSMEKVSSEVLASSVNTNPVVVRRILGALNRMGLIRAERGKAGGISLARAPSKVSLLDIYRAVLTEQELVALHDNPKNPKCLVSCKVRDVLACHLEKAQHAFERELAKVTLRDIKRAI